jgi:hypothetical protein
MRMLSVLVSRSKVTVANDVHLNSQLVYPAPDFLNLLLHTWQRHWSCWTCQSSSMAEL